MSINKGINFPEYLQEKIASICAKSTDIDNIYVSVNKTLTLICS